LKLAIRPQWLGSIQHILESTVFAATIWLLTLALRRHQARARYVLWMTASIKFLIPFSRFVAMGSHAVRPAPASVPPAKMRFVMADAVPAISYAAIAEVRPEWRAPIAWLIWLGGPAAVLGRWYRRARGAAHIPRESTPAGTRSSTDARCGYPAKARLFPTPELPGSSEPAGLLLEMQAKCSASAAGG
jgi:hypothetical protein